MLLGLALGGALMAHALLGRTIKALLWAWSPLASGEAEACTYQRTVYRTADPTLLPVVGLAACAGLAWGVGLVWSSMLSPWLMLAGVLGVLAALALDLQRWERVAVSGNSLWFQRGLGHTVHQVAIGNIREVTVQESAELGFTLRHLRRNRSARLCLRLADKRQLLLPKTDAFSGSEPIENMANFLRLRLQQLREAALEKARKKQAVKPELRQRDVSRPSPAIQRPAATPVVVSPARPPAAPVSSPAPSAAALRGITVPPPLVMDVVELPPHASASPAPSASRKPPVEDEALYRALRRLRHDSVAIKKREDKQRVLQPTAITEPTTLKVRHALPHPRQRRSDLR